MATRRIVWDTKAAAERKEILEYWALRTKSYSYSKKLHLLFSKTLKKMPDSCSRKKF